MKFTMQNFRYKVPLVAAVLLMSSSASASEFTNTTPTGFDVTTVGASTVGGIVLELIGANGARIISQTAASTLFEGIQSFSPGTIGTQIGFDSSVTDLLGGGLQSAAIRVTLDDGDSAPGDFDDGDNTLLVNGIDFGNFSEVTTQTTDSAGVALGTSLGMGFGNNILDTGYFSSTDAGDLASLFASLTSTQVTEFEITDLDPGDNVLDFTQGIDQILANTGVGPTVMPVPPTPPTNPVPEPSTLALFAIGLSGLGFARRRKVMS